MKKYDYDVVIIGAGSAGLAAVKELKKRKDRFLLIDQGPLGTTCARVGCMPSKVLLQNAHDYKKARELAGHGLITELGPLDRSRLMKRVRHMRDHFVSFVLRDLDGLQDHFLKGHAEFLDPHTIRVDGKKTIHTRATIIATGSEPIIPEEYKDFREQILTTDEIFELDDLPDRWAVVGLGPIGLEIGQALSWMGLQVAGFDMAESIGGLRDPIVNSAAIHALQKDMKLTLGSHAIPLRENFDKILMAVGRKPRLAGLNLESFGARLDDKGRPPLDDHQAIEGLPIYLAGDVDGKAPILHEAAWDGKRAARYALGEKRLEKERLRLALVFSQPNLGSVGLPYDKLGDALIGEARFEDQGRAKILGLNDGCLHLYVDRKAGTILGAELAAPAGEHLLHLIGSFVQQKLSVREALKLPFYHPSVEEGLRTALKHAGGFLDKS